ncbi:MAG TPA: response regulator transcription factor [Gaiellaceae bacterium]|jgi:DNA-binding NarL/FixJ family response regulator|nr:response regulator transcription factor [Gaiellaceae bacterium]
MGSRGHLRVLIADDHDLFAESVEAFLSIERRIDVVGRAANGEEATELASAIKPDVVLMDISMPVMDGFAAAERIRRELPDTCVLFLTGSNAPSDVAKARAAGGSGYVTKDRIASELVNAILDASPPCPNGPA